MRFLFFVSFLSFTFSQENVEEALEAVGERLENVGEHLEGVGKRLEKHYENIEDRAYESTERKHDRNSHAPLEQNIITDETKLFGDHTIKAGTVESNNIRILGGDLFVYGTVDGKITVVGGDIILGPVAVVNGTIIAIGGHVQKDESTIINGKIIETHLKEGLIYRELESADPVEGGSNFKIKERSMRATESWIHPETDLFIYNRNEGFLFTPLNSEWDSNGKSSFRLSFTLGYRFGSKEPAGRLTLEKSFFSNSNLIFFGSLFKESRTDDFYRLSEMENSLAGILGRQDFYDRWDEEGWSAGAGLDLYRIKFKFQVAVVSQDSIGIDSDLWSLFEKERPLRTNRFTNPQPSIGYLQITAAFRTKHYSPVSTGLALFLQGEAYQKTNDGYNSYTLESEALRKRMFGFAKINWELSYGLVFRSQLMAGISGERLHEFRQFGVGGVGSVSAFPFKYQLGQQMIQTNAELIFTGEFTDEWFFLKIFFHGGYAWNEDEIPFNSNNVMDYGISSAGVGIGSGDDDDMNFSVNIAKPLDGSNHLETTVRVDYNF